MICVHTRMNLFYLDQGKGEGAFEASKYLQRQLLEHVTASIKGGGGARRQLPSPGFARFAPLAPSSTH